MLRAVALAFVLAILPSGAPGQATGVLRVKVALVDSDRKATPVVRHALLISDNPASGAPRRLVTGLDGNAEAKLRPGSYIVESDLPVAFQGRAYLWTQVVVIVSGRDTVLELTADNAEIEAVAAATGTAAAPPETDPVLNLPQWQNSVLALWTPTAQASGFVIGTNGLIVTNQRVVGSAASVEVQLTPARKVAARVLVSDVARDVAVLWIDPKAIDAVRPVPLPCPQAAGPVLAAGQEIFAIGAPPGQQRRVTSGTVSRVDPHAIVSDLRVARGGAGGPVFTSLGELAGLTSIVNEHDQASRGDSPVVPVGDACVVVAGAEQKMKDAVPPGGAHLPVEPERPFPVDALQQAVARRTGSLASYQLSSSTFDVTFITPVLNYGARHQPEQAGRRDRGSGPAASGPDQARVRPLMDFSNWSSYVETVPPVLLVRMTPRLVEGFWTMVARGAARTQGVSIPPIKRFKSGFSRLRAYCGDAEVTPIHPFKLEQRVSETDAIYEGLYVFDPGAFGPHCKAVTLVLYSEKEPEKGESRVVGPGVVQQIWDDFAPYRVDR